MSHERIGQLLLVRLKAHFWLKFRGRKNESLLKAKQFPSIKTTRQSNDISAFVFTQRSWHLAEVDSEDEMFVAK